jgi:hypothetical protein
MRAASLGLAVAIGLALGCSRADEEQAATKRAPSLPPPPGPGTPAMADIPVTVDGAPAEPITAARLAAVAPDFSDDERRAWRLDRLIPGFVAGKVALATSREGAAVALSWPATASDRQPVLFVTRRGEVVATLVDPAQPFPEFHGEGGRRRRPGDPTPRVSPVVRLDVRAAP